MAAESPFTESIPFSDLPTWSPWPARLQNNWVRNARTMEDLKREYDKEKYASCLEYIREHPGATVEDIRTFEFGNDLDREICVSIGEDLFRTTMRKAWEYQNEALLSRMAELAGSADIICELGCGYGYYLWLLKQKYPDKKFYGIDFSANAITLANALFADGSITISQGDLTDPNLQLPFGKDASVMLFSFYAYDNFPSATASIQALCNLKGPKWNFVFIEPVFEWCSDSDLGKLRRAYTVANDYSRDLLTVLQSHADITLTKTEKEFLGVNPLHPVSFLQWK